MEGTMWIIRTDEQKANAAAAVATCPVNPDKPFCLKIELYEDKRSKAQNRLSHQWYLDIATQGKEYIPAQVKAKCKYRYGLPIMRADEVYMKVWNIARFDERTYPEILKILEEYPMTKWMSIKQMSQYLTDLQNENGSKYKLTDPSMYGLGKL